jgi:hypothetical protein
VREREKGSDVEKGRIERKKKSLVYMKEKFAHPLKNKRGKEK